MAVSRLLTLALLGGMSAAVWAQSPATPKLKDCEPGQDSTKAVPCTPVSAADRFKFPGDDPAPAKSSSPSVSAPDAPLPSAPGATAGSQPSSADKKFPFPSDTSGTANSGPTGESSSSSSNSSGDIPLPDDQPDTPKLTDKGSSGGRGKGTKIQTPDERVDEDLQVGNFYRNDGNFQGAYLRAKDAFALMPDDADVNLLYAQVAQKLGKKDEALDHYRAFLKLDPKNKKAKDATDAIEQLSGTKR